MGLGGAIIEKLLEDSKNHAKVILYANPGKEGFYEKFGFKKMNTAMAVFENEQAAVKSGILKA